MWWFSPLIRFWVFIVFVFSDFQFHVGEIHRVDFNYYSRSPLSEPFLLYYVLLFRKNVGEIHRVVVDFLTLILPSLNRNIVFYWKLVFRFNSDVGEIHRVDILLILVLPLCF